MKCNFSVCTHTRHRACAHTCMCVDTVCTIYVNECSFYVYLRWIHTWLCVPPSCVLLHQPITTAPSRSQHHHSTTSSANHRLPMISKSQQVWLGTAQGKKESSQAFTASSVSWFLSWTPSFTFNTLHTHIRPQRASLKSLSHGHRAAWLWIKQQHSHSTVCYNVSGMKAQHLSDISSYSAVI